MKIIIVGFGETGRAISKTLSAEKYADISVIDNNPSAFGSHEEHFDFMRIEGDCLQKDVLLEANVENADLVICVTDSDERNFLCCMIAKENGVKTTMARVRNPEFERDIHAFNNDKKVDELINPELQTAYKILNLLWFQKCNDIKTFPDTDVKIVSYVIPDGDTFFTEFQNKKTADIKFARFNVSLILVERGGNPIMPNDTFTFKKSDNIKILGKSEDLHDFFRNIDRSRLKNIAIIGGGNIAENLLYELHNHRNSYKIAPKIIEQSQKRCDLLKTKYSAFDFVCGDGNSEDVINSEIAGWADAVVCLTGKDEKNIISAMYAKYMLNLQTTKIVLRIDNMNKSMVEGSDIGKIIFPPEIISEQLLTFVRALNREGQKLKSVQRIIDNAEHFAEAVLFQIESADKCTGVKIKDLKLKNNVYISCILRNGEIILSSRTDEIIKSGDDLIVISIDTCLSKIDDAEIKVVF